MSKLNIAEKQALQRVADKPELRAHFFSGIKKLKWFDAINKLGFLNPKENPHPQTVKEQYINVPNWPVLEYLVSSSEHLKNPEHSHYAEKFLGVIRDVTDYAIKNNFNNHRTWWYFSKIIRNIPIEILTVDDYKRIRYWVNDTLDRSLVGNELGGWLRDLLSNYNLDYKQHILSLMDIVFEIIKVTSIYSQDKYEAALPIDNYFANKLIEDISFIAGEKIGSEAILLFESKLQSTLEIHENDRWSAIWRPAIEDHEQNRLSDDAQALMIKAFRESLAGLLNTNIEGGESHLSNLLSSNYQLMRRIGIYTASNYFDKISERTRLKAIDEQNFKDPYRHELWWFLKRNFHKLKPDIRDGVVSTINDMTVKDDEENTREDATAYKKSLWLSSIFDVSESANNIYQELISVIGNEPEHPDFASYSYFGTVVNESPVEVAELREMLQEPSNLVKFLNGYKNKGSFREPGIEGLVEAFGALINEIFDELPNYFEHFLHLKPHFVNEIYTTFSEAWNNKVDVDWNYFWPSIFDFSLKLVDDKSFWESPLDGFRGAFIGNRIWVIGSISKLIEDGCKNDKRAFSLDSISPAKLLLEKILAVQDGAPFTDTKDAISVSINSPRGKCLISYINIALYDCRNNQSNENNHENVWQNYEALFSSELLKKEQGEYEFATLVAMYLHNFKFLSEQWVYKNLPLIFDISNHSAWLCSVQGYSNISRFDENIYFYLKDSGNIVRILNSEEIKENIKNRYIQLITLSYYHNKESIDNDDSLINILLKRKNIKELSTVIRFIWTLRNEERPRTKDVVYDLFPRLIQCIDSGSNVKAKLASRLCTWADFLYDFNEREIDWLSKIACYAEEDFNTSHVMDALARLSDRNPMKASEIWLLVLQSRPYDYPDGPIIQIFKKLVALGAPGQRAAKEIAGIYYEHGYRRPLQWLAKIQSEQ